MLPGSSEWLIIFGVALLLFGPSKLPQLGGAIGASIRNFKKGMKGLHEEGDEHTPQIAEGQKDKKSEHV
jgi:sec-independent protein translocase protein TatA